MKALIGCFGTPVCPSCGSVESYGARRQKDALRVRCKGCKRDFTITSGTLFASHKLPLMAPARTKLRNISAACAGPRSASTITLLARICSAMRRSHHGGKIIVASRMAIR